MKKLLYIGLGLMAAVGISSCQADMDTPELDIPTAPVKANMTILDLKNLYAGESQRVKYLPGTEVYDEEGNLIDGEHIFIHGRVISSDASGNIYKNLVIQDETAALTFSLNQASMYINNRLGQDVVVDMTGLCLGYYRNLQQVGYSKYIEPLETGEIKFSAIPSSEKYDDILQLGFMAYDYWMAQSYKNGLPNEKFTFERMGGQYPDGNAYYITLSSLNDLSGIPLAEMQSQLVELQNVHFSDAEAGIETFAPYEDSANRTLIFADGTSMIVRNSGYSNFYNQVLPKGTGTVRGILSYYGSDWQLVLRDRDDVQISTKGQLDDPYTVEEAIEAQGLSGWMQAYIVGSVKAGVSTVASDADIILGAAAEMDNNLVVAAHPNEKDWKKCICVELPQGSIYRQFGNLADNPSMYGRQLLLHGSFSSFLGMPGLTGLDGLKTLGETEGATPEAKGDGSEANPYNMGYVLNATADEADVWVEGYVAGYVKGSSWATAEFSDTADSSSSNYMNSSNVILSEENPLFSGTYNSIPAGLNNAVKATLGLKNNPAVYGKRVKVKCSITRDYLGTVGVYKVKEAVIL